MRIFKIYAIIFQSTLPTRGSDGIVCTIKFNIMQFQSTLPTRGSDHYFAVDDYYVQFISIHAPHEGERLLLNNS